MSYQIRMGIPEMKELSDDLRGKALTVLEIEQNGCYNSECEVK